MGAKKKDTAGDKAAEQVQELIDVEVNAGFRGVEVDPTPNENYTLAGVTAGLPTPETDDEAAEKARAHRAGIDTDGREKK